MKTITIFIALLLIAGSIFAQGSAIHGKVTDEKGNPMFAANVSVKTGNSIAGSTTDFDGIFKLKPLSPGTYNVEVSFVGYKSVMITGVKVYNNQITFMNDVVMAVQPEMKNEVVIIGEREKMIKIDNPSSIPVPAATIIKMPGAKNPIMVARAICPEIQVVENKMVIRGSRPGSSSVFIDGVRVADEMSSIPSLAIGSMEIYTGGIPSKYGDVTGGVVMMTTKGYFDILNERRAMESLNEEF